MISLVLSVSVPSVAVMVGVGIAMRDLLRKSYLDCFKYVETGTMYTSSSYSM